MIIATLIKDTLLEGSNAEREQAIFELPHNNIGPPAHITRHGQMWSLKGTWDIAANGDFIAAYYPTSSYVWIDISHVAPVVVRANAKVAA